MRGFIANRRELLTRGGLPAEISDAELLVDLYEDHGLHTPALIAGSLTWALWDSQNQRLIAARDRLGIYGLYYTCTGTQIHLAGDVSSLLPATQATLNSRAIASQISGQAPPAGETFYINIQAVGPGSLLIVARERLVSERYWDIVPQPLQKLTTDACYAEVFREQLFRIIVEYCPRRPVGITLSGGLDSTTVAAALRNVSPNASVAAFSWISPELPEADESREIFATAEKLQCSLYTIPADQFWPLRTDPGIRTSPASPFFNFYHDLWDGTFREAVRRGVTELHSGLGGDHMFGGNAFSYPDLLLTGRWGRLVSEIRAHLPFSAFDLPHLLRRMVLGPVARTLLPHLKRWRTKPPAWLGAQLRDLLDEELPETPRHFLPGRQTRLTIMREPLLPVIAEALTSQAARHGVELRHPLLDHRLFELAASLPTTQAFAAGMQKIILRNAMRGLLPDEVVERRQKIYPNTIAERGLRERERAKVWALMTNMVAAKMGFVDEARLREEYQRYLDGKTRSALFWHTLTLESWLRDYFA
jgi:asparagine synthase (glutamine-hydrolysing)